MKYYDNILLIQEIDEQFFVDLLLKKNLDKIRYCRETRSFYVYDKVRWKQADDHIDLLVMLRKTIDEFRCENITRCVTEDQKLTFLKSIKKCLRINSLKGTLEILKMREEVHIAKEQFDTDPCLLAVPNGTVDLSNGELTTSKESDFITRMCQTPFFPEAKCPKFEGFLSDITAGSKALVQYILMVLGYCLTGLTTEQKLYIFDGPGGNGKTVLLETMRKVLGKQLVVHVDSKTLVKNRRQIREDIARFEGARLATCSEIGIKDTLDEPLIKGLSGGDQIVSRKLRENSREFQNVAKIIIATNILPNIEATDHGVERRLEVIPFNQTFKGDKMDKGLMGKLLEEKEGILALLVRYAKMYIEKDKIKLPEEVIKATENYVKTSNSVRCFVRECTQETIESSSELTLRGMYDAYFEYCSENGHRASSLHDFSRLMKLQGYVQRKSGPCRYWTGLTLSTSQTDSVDIPSSVEAAAPAPTSGAVEPTSTGEAVTLTAIADSSTVTDIVTSEPEPQFGQIPQENYSESPDE